MANGIEKDSMVSEINDLVAKYKKQLKSVDNIKKLDELEIEILGRKSKLTNILKKIQHLKVNADKKQVGQLANIAKQGLIAEHDKLKKEFTDKLLAGIEKKEKIDISLPGNIKTLGHLHPVTQMAMWAEDIFMRMGFEVYYPYVIDSDYNNFEALNFPKDHPARDNWDTFWTEDGHIAIPHTSSMQNRILSGVKPPIRAIVPGRCFRNEASDARHDHTFFQIEGIYVDKGINLTHMLGTLKEFFSKFYEKDVEVKFTPDFFPFVEPGGMMSLSCILCNGKGCAVCKKTGWLEILGCGMIHPKVLEMANVDPKTYSGFAWGFGLERLIMLKYNIDDIRYFYNGNLDFLKQF